MNKLNKLLTKITDEIIDGKINNVINDYDKYKLMNKKRDDICHNFLNTIFSNEYNCILITMLNTILTNVNKKNISLINNFYNISKDEITDFKNFQIITSSFVKISKTINSYTLHDKMKNTVFSYISLKNDNIMTKKYLWDIFKIMIELKYILIVDTDNNLYSIIDKKN
jgi:hypothetical protein